MKNAVNDVLRLSAQFFGLVPTEQPAGAEQATVELNAAPTVTA